MYNITVTYKKDDREVNYLAKEITEGMMENYRLKLYNDKIILINPDVVTLILIEELEEEK